MSKRILESRFAFIGLVLIVLALRVIAAQQVGMEVDEPINYTAARFISRVGYPALRGELHEAVRAYHFHPFFGFYVIWGWMQVFGLGVIQARLLSAVTSTLAITMLSIFLRRVVDKPAGTICLMLLGLDGWMVVTNSMVYLENIQMVLIVVAVILYYRAISVDGKESLIRYMIAGVAIALPFIYKHIGVYLIFGVVAYWLIDRRHWKGHIVLGIMVALVTIAYGTAMYVRWHGEWLEPTMVQVYRTFGLRPSRGLNYGIGHIIEVVTERYWIFPTTIVGLLGGAAIAAAGYSSRILRRIVARPNLHTALTWGVGAGLLSIGILFSNQYLMLVGVGLGVTFRSAKAVQRIVESLQMQRVTWVIVAWSVGALVFGAGAALKSPHYFMLWQLPLLTLLAIGLTTLYKKRPKTTMVILAVVVVMNAGTYYTRVLTARGNAVERSADFMGAMLPQDAIIGTEPYIGVLIPQPYARIDQSSPEELLALKVEYLGLYRSTTADIPQAIGGRRNVARYCATVQVFDGFKDTVEVCKINRDALQQFVEERRLEQPPPEGVNMPPP
ncbi:glycosyltransferase family 39 protein [candidate division WWE3 bacterium]|nr:glycosyltransferase family 39 protein [candidate division WWE3 bacterium]